MGRQRMTLSLYAAVMGMEMCYLYLGLELFRSTGLDWASFILILTLYPLAFLFKWLIARSNESARRTGRLVIISGISMISVIALLAVLRLLFRGSIAELNVFLVIVQIGLAGLSWWLGGTLLRDETSYRHLVTRFQCGLLVMLMLAPATGSFLLVILFFLLALFVLAVARWDSSLTRSPAVLQAFPIGVLAWSSLGVFAPAIAIFFLLSPGTAQVLVGWLAAIISAIGRLFPAQAPQTTPTQPQEFDFSCACKPSEEGGVPLPTPPPPGTPTQENPVLLWIIIFIVYIAVLVAVALAIKRIRLRRREMQPATIAVESTTISMSMLHALAGFFRRLGNRLWRYLLSMLRFRHAFRRGTSGEEPATSVRSVYRSLLRLAAKKGAIRQPSQTPLEFLKLLQSLFPGREDEAALITRIYVEDRYGRRPLGEDSFRLAREAWQRITVTR